MINKLTQKILDQKPEEHQTIFDAAWDAFVATHPNHANDNLLCQIWFYGGFQAGKDSAVRVVREDQEEKDKSRMYVPKQNK